MGVKSDDHRFSANPYRLRLHFLDDLAMSVVHAVEGADGDDGLPEDGQAFENLVYLHIDGEINEM